MSRFVLSTPQRRRPGNTLGIASVWNVMEDSAESPDRPFIDGVAWDGQRTDTLGWFSAGCARNHAWESPDDLALPEVVSLPPFTVVASDECGTVGPRGLDRVADRARASLAAGEAYAVEQILATGDDEAGAAIWDAGELADGARFFTDDASVDTVGAAADPTLAVAALEETFYENEHMAGTLHATWPAFMVLARNGIIAPASGISGARPHYRTAAGTLVAGGMGYTGAQPDGTAAAAGTSWLYMTGDVHAWRSEVQELSDYGRSDGSNRRIVAAQRLYTIATDGATWLGKAMNLTIE